MKMKVEVEVSKESYELASGLAKFMAAVKKEIEDNGGWSATDDVPGIIAASVTELLPAMDGVMSIAAEIEEDKTAFAKGVALGLSEIVEIFVSKKTPAEPAVGI